MAAYVLRFCFALIFSFLVTLYLVPILSKVACRLGVMDMPDGHLKCHNKPVAYLGGLSLYLGFLITALLVLPLEHRFFMFILASTLLLFIGLLDDLVALLPAQKFFGQIIATLCYLKAGLYLKESFLSHSLNVWFSFWWFLIVINAFNLIDVMDGLASIIALFVALTLLLFAALFKQYILVLLLVSFIGAVGGFFVYNRPPARVYLGDAGSLFIGGFLASVPFTISWSEYNYWGYLSPLIIFAIPLLELASLILIRLYKGIPFYQGSPNHFCHYLLRKGWSKVRILWYCAILSVVLASIVYLFFYSRITLVETLFSLVALFFFWCATLV